MQEKVPQIYPARGVSIDIRLEDHDGINYIPTSEVSITITGISFLMRHRLAELPLIIERRMADIMMLYGYSYKDIQKVINCPPDSQVLIDEQVKAFERTVFSDQHSDTDI